MLDDIQKNLVYPDTEADMVCRVFVSFIIDSTGKMVDTKVVKGYNEIFDKEALRVVNLLEQWEPGEINGKKVSNKIILPVRFD